MLDPLLISAIAGGVAVLLTAIGAFLHSASQAQQIRAQLRAIHHRVDHETSPNHGSSLRDAIDQIAATQRGMARDVGRLADADVEIQHQKSREHDRLWAAIQDLKETPLKGGHHGS